MFNPKPLRADKLDCRLGQQQIEKLITATGRADGVKVAEKVKGDAVKVKYATAHDLRRSFGDRWAARIMPQMLMELMRHESIEVTLRYYVGRNAQQTASVLYEAVGGGVGVNLGVSDDSSQENNKPRGEVTHNGASVSG